MWLVSSVQTTLAVPWRASMCVIWSLPPTYMTGTAVQAPHKASCIWTVWCWLPCKSIRTALVPIHPISCPYKSGSFGTTKRITSDVFTLLTSEMPSKSFSKKCVSSASRTRICLPKDRISSGVFFSLMSVLNIFTIKQWLGSSSSASLFSA